LQFRMGVNIGDVIVEGDNLYGDGVNVAARLESVARPGSICVSAKVYDEVRRKLSGISFVDGGAQMLKNIEDPVAIYHVGLAGEAVPVVAAPAVSAAPEKPVVAVQPIRLISGDDEAKALAEGLTDAIGDALGHQTALTVKSGNPGRRRFRPQGLGAGGRQAASPVLRAGGCASAAQVWTQRYDRQLDDVFGLQDEIVLHVVAAIRIRVKAQLFERLRGADNATLATPQLLDKAAGIFIRSLDRGGEAVSTLRLAVERAPENSMARAMLGFGLYRVADYHASAMHEATREEIVATLDRAVVLDPRSYFARAIKALALQDLLGDARGAREQASEGLKHNANFIPAKGMLGIAEIHLGNIAEGMRLLQEAMEASPEDASQHRHRRELAIALLLAGRAAEALRVAAQLWEEKPDMKRNALVLAGLLAACGEAEAARRHVAALKAETPGLTLETARLPCFGDRSAGERFRGLLRDSGL
jgi:Predicted integral membrane protein